MKTIHIFRSLLLGSWCLSCYGQIQQNPLIAEGAELRELASDCQFTEGPAADRSGNVFFTDQPNDRILKWSEEDQMLSVYMRPSGRANGLYFDHHGNLLACADEKFELWRIDKDKKVSVLLADFEGQKLNGPNDLWVDPKGGIYFTDPYYQRPYWQRKNKEIEKEQVYYLNPDTGKVKVVADDLAKPNGIIGTPDGKKLYVADIGDDKTYIFDIDMDGSLSNKTLFTELGSDGMTLDNQGNVYLTGDGVRVFDRNGKELLHIPIPQKWTANVTFGGKDQKTLFITAMNAFYALQMKVSGVRY